MLQLIEEQALLPRGVTVVCAVSGGADSICLLHRLYWLQNQLGIRLVAAHFNHKLREDDSDRDEAFVAQFIALCCTAQTLSDGTALPGVPLLTGAQDVAAAAKSRGVGLEEAARDLRYAFLRQAARQTGAQRIATAHTADDNVETVLFHMARGSGLRGLTGIPVAREELVRPLLTTTRQEIEAYLSYHGLPYRVDQSNFDLRFTRNRIRHRLSPVLEELFPQFAPRLAETAALLRKDEEFLTGLARQAAQQAVLTPAGLSIPARAVGDQPDPVATRAVRLLIEKLSPASQACTGVHLNGVVALCRKDAPSARLDLPGGLTARRSYETLLLARTQERVSLPALPLLLPGVTLAGFWRVVCRRELYQGQAHTPFDFFLRDKGNLSLRPRREGDRLTLPGRASKTVKKWCIDEKIPRLRRDMLPVLVWGETLAAVVGLGPHQAALPEVGAAAWHITATDCG
jgi:tRNA(Ile)-lysidine synthetase-like protein